MDLVFKGLKWKAIFGILNFLAQTLRVNSLGIDTRIVSQAHLSPCSPVTRIETEGPI